MNLQLPNEEFGPSAKVAGRFSRFRPSRESLRKPLMIGGPLLVAVIAAAMWITGGRYVSTDNAYIHARKLMVSADVSGIVSDVLVHEGQALPPPSSRRPWDGLPRISAASAFSSSV